MNKTHILKNEDLELNVFIFIRAPVVHTTPSPTGIYMWAIDST